jgi:single-stranded DNA-binding protein
VDYDNIVGIFDKSDSVYFLIETCTIKKQWAEEKTGTVTRKVQILFFEKMAEIAGECLSRGLSVYVEGKLKTEERQGKEGD